MIGCFSYSCSAKRFSYSYSREPIAPVSFMTAARASTGLRPEYDHEYEYEKTQ